MVRHTVLAVAVCLLIVACASEQPLPTLAPTSAPALLTAPPTPLVTVTAEERPPTSTPGPVPGPSPEAPPPLALSVGPGVPMELAAEARRIAAANPGLFAWLEDGEEGPERRAILDASRGRAIARWVYALAAPFATVADGAGWPEIQAGWATGSNVLGVLVIDAESAAAFGAVWGAPGEAAQIVAAPDLVSALWAARPSWTLVPFHRLEPRLKVLAVDGVSPLDPGFDPAGYPLAMDFGLSGDETAAGLLRSAWQAPQGNYHPEQLTRVAMTGVTALSRATAFQMEIGGVTSPGVDVGPVLRAADFAHISHEAPFSPDCPYPNPVGDPLFCARDHYLELLTSIGTNIIELTGNHVNDWGPQNMLYTLDLYEAASFAWFGGGRDLAEARRPLLLEHNGNRLAFVGCNPVGPPGAWAAEGRAGSNPCDLPAFYEQIGRLRDEGYLVIATLQYEEYYQYEPTAGQREAFRALAQAGAAAVSGSQGHHAQGFDLHEGAFIHFGLGNLFFDQMQMPGTRQSFIDTYAIYQGKLISVRLFTGLIENYCCPRAMGADERAQLLETVFRASGW
jgi:hypothetical protein